MVSKPGKQDREEDDGEAGGGKRKTPGFTFGGSSQPAGTGVTGGFSFGAGSTPAASPFSFGGASAKPAPFSFGGAAEKPAPAFQFGAGAATGGASTGFSFGGAPAASAGGGFAFKVAAPAAAAAADDDDADETPDPDQKPEVAKSEANENEEVINWGGSEAKAALNTLTDTKEELEAQLADVETAAKDGVKEGMTVAEATAALEAGKKANFKQWKKRGVSTIALVKDKASGNLMLRMRSENGQQLLLNDWAHTTKTTKVADKKLTLITPSGASHMLRFGKQETRDELFECAAMSAPL
jgi:hypothetical protein